MSRLGETQRRILLSVALYRRERGQGPTWVEIRTALGLTAGLVDEDVLEREKLAEEGERAFLVEELSGEGVTIFKAVRRQRRRVA